MDSRMGEFRVICPLFPMSGPEVFRKCFLYLKKKRSGKNKKPPRKSGAAFVVQ